MLKYWPWGGASSIVWINEPRPSEAAVVLPPFDYQLSRQEGEAIMLIEVPKFGSQLREKAFEVQERKG